MIIKKSFDLWEHSANIYFRFVNDYKQAQFHLSFGKSTHNSYDNSENPSVTECPEKFNNKDCNLNKYLLFHKH